MKQSLPYFAPFSDFRFVYFCHLTVHLKLQFCFSWIFWACLLQINSFNASLAKSVLEFL